MVFFLCSVSCEVIVISIAADGKQLFANENTITLDEISKLSPLFRILILSFQSLFFFSRDQNLHFNTGEM